MNDSVARIGLETEILNIFRGENFPRSTIAVTEAVNRARRREGQQEAVVPVVNMYLDRFRRKGILTYANREYSLV